MPRALFWFRWGAAWTWITGVLLAGLIYYQSKEVLFEQDHIGNPWLWLAILARVVGPRLRDLQRDHEGAGEQGRRRGDLPRPLRRRLAAARMRRPLQRTRALHSRRRDVRHDHGAERLDGDLAVSEEDHHGAEGRLAPAGRPTRSSKTAGLRSRHNTYMSVPLVFFMISNHYPTMFSDPYRDLCATGVIVVGFIATRLLYGKAPKVPGF